MHAIDILWTQSREGANSFDSTSIVLVRRANLIEYIIAFEITMLCFVVFIGALFMLVFV